MQIPWGRPQGKITISKRDAITHELLTTDSSNVKGEKPRGGKGGRGPEKSRETVEKQRKMVKTQICVRM
jgi:hypothetical protein